MLVCIRHISLCYFSFFHRGYQPPSLRRDQWLGRSDDWVVEWGNFNVWVGCGPKIYWNCEGYMVSQQLQCLNATEHTEITYRGENWCLSVEMPNHVYGLQLKYPSTLVLGCLFFLFPPIEWPCLAGQRATLDVQKCLFDTTHSCFPHNQGFVGPSSLFVSYHHSLSWLPLT